MNRNEINDRNEIINDRNEINNRNEKINDIIETCRIVIIIINRRIPKFTVIVSIVQIVLLIWVLSIGGFDSPQNNPMLGPNVTVLLNAGAKWTPYIVQQGEWWRLISALFLHMGFVHLICNLILQLGFGWLLELRYGSIRYGILYMISGIGSILTSAIFLPYLVTVGCSGSLMGLTALYILDIIQEYKTTPYAKLLLIVSIVSVLVTFLIGLIPIIDNFAHIGGFIFGLELSIIMFLPLSFKFQNFKKYERPMRIRILLIPFMIGIFLLHVIGFFYLLYGMPDVRIWCPDCKYVSCIPRIVDGVDWCY